MTYFEEIASKMEVGKKYTIAFMNDFGYCSCVQVKLTGVEARSYAQYNDALHLKFRKPRQKKDRGVILYSRKSFVIYDGWVDVDQNMWGESQVSESSQSVVTRAKYMSCDIRNLTDIIDSSDVEPLAKHLGVSNKG